MRKRQVKIDTEADGYKITPLHDRAQSIFRKPFGFDDPRPLFSKRTSVATSEQMRRALKRWREDRS